MDNKPSYNDLLKKIEQLESSMKESEANVERLESLLALSQMEHVSEKEIREFALESVVSLTRSVAGYLHFVDDEEKTINLVSWSTGALKLCSAVKTLHYPVDKAGVWADSIRLRKPVMHNDYQNMQGKKGYPEGHFPVIRHLGVPIFDEEKIVAVAGVANKKSLYDVYDLKQTMLFMNSMWTILKQKKSLEEIKILQGLIPMCMVCKNIRNDKGAWDQLEKYISEHSDAKFTHGICPDCLKKHMDEKKRSKMVDT